MADTSSAKSGAEQAKRFPAGWLASEWRQNAPVYVLVAALMVFTIISAEVRDEPLAPFFGIYASRAAYALITMAYAGVVLLAIRAMFRNEGSPFAALRTALVATLKADLLLHYVFACLVLTVLMGAFLYNKMLIPAYVPFQWDATFAEWDRMLFAGREPWEVLHPYIGYPAVTGFFDFMYTLWIPLMFVFWAGAAAPRVPPDLRTRFWLATVASWILVGLVMATLLSSAGPCYFAKVVSDVPSPYAGLEAYLQSVMDSRGLMANETKAYLWRVYTGDIDGPGGISAMPSMHNAQALLFTAFAYRLDRRFGHLMSAYAVIIFIGSIHLGWHYAVDGIIAAAAATVIWWASGRYIAAARRRRVGAM